MAWHSAGALTGWAVEDVGSSAVTAAGDALTWLSTFQRAGGEGKFRGDFGEMVAVSLIMVQSRCCQLCVPPLPLCHVAAFGRRCKIP